MRIYLRNIANNPYFVFSLAWSMSLFLYILKLAGILPQITSSLFIFIMGGILLFGLTGFFLKKINFLIIPKQEVKINYKVLFFINNIFFLPNFLYSGVPILNGLRDNGFGVPGLMILSTSFNAFTCLCCYYMYLTTGRRKFLLYCVYCLLLFTVIVSRGSIMMTLVTMFFLWMNVKNPRLNFKWIFIIFISGVFVLYLFGVAGNQRTISTIANAGLTDKEGNPVYKVEPIEDNEIPYSSDFILNLGNASDVFRNQIPGEFFWSYLYITSPLSNLQYNINVTDSPFTLDNFYLAVVNETMFDFISKRVDANRRGFLRKTPILLLESLTVCTTFAGSYATAGWGGMFYVLIFLWLFPVIYIVFIAKNQLAVIGISVLCTVYFFSIFDNMLVLSGLSGQMFLPIIVMFFQKLKFKESSSSSKSPPVTTVQIN
jgi:hypothetical protein